MNGIEGAHRQNVVDTGTPATEQNENLPGVSSTAASPAHPQLQNLRARPQNVGARSPSERLGRPPRRPSRLLPPGITNGSFDTVIEAMVGRLQEAAAARWPNSNFSANPGAVREALEEALEIASSSTPFARRPILDLAAMVARTILDNAALSNRLYALENGPDSDRVIEMIGSLVEATPADRRDAVLRHLTQNWDSHAEDFFEVCSQDEETGIVGARRLAGNLRLNKALGLNSQPFSDEARQGALEVLDILCARFEVDRSQAVLTDGEYTEAANKLFMEFPFRHGADLFWLRQTDRFRDMPPLPGNAAPEMTIAALAMHHAGIGFSQYSAELLLADARRKDEDTGGSSDIA